MYTGRVRQDSSQVGNCDNGASVADETAEGRQRGMDWDSHAQGLHAWDPRASGGLKAQAVFVMGDYLGMSGVK